MANVFTTLADLVKLNDLNARDLGASDILNDAPFLRVLNATTASNGTNHNYIKMTTAPTAGFRAVNTGRYVGAAGWTEVTIALKYLDATVVEDKAIADSYKNGPDAFLARAATANLQQALFAVEQQIFYGTGADANGFAGLSNNSAFDGAADTMVVDATGTTASTGSSVWLIRTTADEKDMTAVIGNDGEIKVGQVSQVLKADDTTPAKSYAAYMVPVSAYIGLQIGTAYSAVRIANLTADSGKGLTDALIATAMAKFPASKGPTHIVANRRSLMQLQRSRTATNSTGAPAPFPTESFGVPIIVTDSLSSTEALLT